MPGIVSRARHNFTRMCDSLLFSSGVFLVACRPCDTRVIWTEALRKSSYSMSSRVCDVTECQSGVATSFIYLSAISFRIDFSVQAEHWCRSRCEFSESSWIFFLASLSTSSHFGLINFYFISVVGMLFVLEEVSTRSLSLFHVNSKCIRIPHSIGAEDIFFSFCVHVKRGDDFMHRNRYHTAWPFDPGCVRARLFKHAHALAPICPVSLYFSSINALFSVSIGYVHAYGRTRPW